MLRSRGNGENEADFGSQRNCLSRDLLLVMERW